MNSIPLRSASALALAAAALAAHAAVDFENLPNPSGVSNAQGDPLVSGGFSFADRSRRGLISIAPDSVLNYTGSVAITANVPRDTIDMSPVDGAAFSLASFQVANYLHNSGGVPLTITGTQVGGGTVSQSYTTLFTDALQTVSLSGFTDLTSVSFASTNFPQIDNIVVNPTPEPSALAALGLGAAAFVKRRKR